MTKVDKTCVNTEVYYIENNHPLTGRLIAINRFQATILTEDNQTIYRFIEDVFAYFDDCMDAIINRMEIASSFEVHDEIFYVTKNNRVGRAVITKIENQTATLEYTILCENQTYGRIKQRRKIVRNINEIFPNEKLCNEYIRSKCGGLGLPLGWRENTNNRNKLVSII